MRLTPKRKQVIHSVDEIPAFVSEEEEDRFWSTHRYSRELLRQGTPPPARVAALLEVARETREREVEPRQGAG